MTKQLAEIPRPFPSEAAQRGLSKITGLDVHFDKCAESSEDAALEHLDDLIAWWRLPSLKWTPAVSKREPPHRKKRPGRR